MCAIQYLNPVYLIQEKQKKLYHFDQFGKIVIQPKLGERIFNLFSSGISFFIMITHLKCKILKSANGIECKLLINSRTLFYFKTMSVEDVY